MSYSHRSQQASDTYVGPQWLPDLLWAFAYTSKLSPSLSNASTRAWKAWRACSRRFDHKLAEDTPTKEREGIRRHLVSR